MLTLTINCRATQLLEPLNTTLHSIERTRQRHSYTPNKIFPADESEKDLVPNHSVNETMVATSQHKVPFSHCFGCLKKQRSVESIRYERIQRKQKEKISYLKLAFSEFYLMLLLLKNFQTLNYTGFRKILKKHDKLFRSRLGEEWQYVTFCISDHFSRIDVSQYIGSCM
jgi:hypothetical protein